MSDKEPAIIVRDLHKSFKLPHEQHSGIKQLLINKLKGTKGYETQHVLENISFEVKKGEFFGIVGRNGSGKSTLLKLLAGIYVPEKGIVQVNGSLTPFIELGVGFNPELTGRENVFLNGALLGFSQSEMYEMYQDIVDFAELEKFMDQKLKNFSSGMQVRLAFSIAIRAKSDILVLDEVLAVGDEAFQRKCNNYFEEIKKDKTKTIILVTHSMEVVKRYCEKAILIRDGKIVLNGSPGDAANQYTQDNFESLNTTQQQDKHKESLSRRVPYFKVTSVSKGILTRDNDLVFDIEYEITDNTPVHVHFAIVDEIRNTPILHNGAKEIIGKGRHKLRYVFPLNIYNNCNLYINAVLDEKGTRKRIAFTNDKNSCRVAVRNKTGNQGLLNTVDKQHGYWEDWEEFTYNKNERSHNE